MRLLLSDSAGSGSPMLRGRRRSTKVPECLEGDPVSSLIALPLCLWALFEESRLEGRVSRLYLEALLCLTDTARRREWPNDLPMVAVPEAAMDVRAWEPWASRF